MSRTNPRLPHRVIGLTLLLLALAVSGCARKNEVMLRQPTAPPSQQALKLVGDWAFHASDGQQDVYTLAFPLPGAAGGPRAFVIYIRVPDRRNSRVDPQAPDAVKGFLLQELGALAGCSNFMGGTLRCRPVLFAPRFRRLDLNIRCEDGTEISGQAVVEDGPRQVQVFEREFAADIAALSPPQNPAGTLPGESAGASDTTEEAPARTPTAPTRQ